jgi:hypothetical protein
MKRQLIIAVLLLGTACAARAQNTNSDALGTDRNVAVEFSASPTERITLFQPPASDELSLAASTSFAATPAPFADAVPEPSPAPAPEPKFLYGGRDDFRWQLAIGADWVRFRSSIFNASAIGFKTSVTYFTNDWFGVEGNVTATFAPMIYQNEHVKLLTYGGGPKIAWREKRWEPWAHAIFGGMHEQPQTAGNSRNTWMIELGGGADYRFNPRFSGRLEGDWVRSAFFNTGQNNFELMGGVVFHF